LRPDVTLIVSPVSQLGAAVGGTPTDIDGIDGGDGGGGGGPITPPGGVGLIKLK